MKKIKGKLWSRKAQSKDNQRCILDVVKASKVVLKQSVGQEADGEGIIPRRFSHGEMRSSPKVVISSCRSLNVETPSPSIAYEKALAEQMSPTHPGSYRRMESRECTELAASTGDLIDEAEDWKNETSFARTPRSVSLDWGKFAAVVEGLRKSHSTYKMKHCDSEGFKNDPQSSNPFRSNSLGNFTRYVDGFTRAESRSPVSGRRTGLCDTSEDDSDKTPTDTTPMGSSTSLTPTGSREDILLQRRVRKRFSRHWRGWSRYCFEKGE